MLSEIRAKLKGLSNPEKIPIFNQYFKTGKGEYGEGDIFLGIFVPRLREVAKEYWQKATFDEIQALLHSKIHDERLVSLFILVARFQKNKTEREKIFLFYTDENNLKWVNNWDLVDQSAYKILGAYLLEKAEKKQILYDFAKSQNMWFRRVAIVSTMAFIKKNQLEDALAIAKILLQDKHDLIHKATGWMLREVCKQNERVFLQFIKENRGEISKATFRYAVEKIEKSKLKN
jgi:3-methyladenine DNA glycosylase AlkD